MWNITYLKQNIRIKIFFLLNSENVALLLSTFSDSYAKIGNQDTAGMSITTCSLI